jgi:iron complex outermembrane recepter protein
MNPSVHVPTSSLAAVLSMLLISALGLAPLPLQAQQAQLQEIVVTAERRSENIQNVPIAITAVSGADLATLGVRQGADITSLVPNMLLNLPYGPEAQPTFTLRGVTTQDFSENQSSPIAMYVDEVYKAVGAVQALQTFDLERVEVLRGPQGTLYGKNATGGAVSFYSRNPSLTDTDGYVTAGGGNYSDYSVRAAAGTPLIDDKLALRVAIYYENRDGWVNSVAPVNVEPLNGVDALAGRLTLLAKPTDSLTATLKASFSKSGGTPYGAHALNNDPNVTGFNGYISWFDNGAKYAVHKDIHNDSVSLKLDWNLAQDMTLTSISAYDYGYWYEKSDDGGLPITLRLDDPNTYFSTANVFSQELRLASKDTTPFSWLGGLYFGHESVHPTVQFHFFDGYAGGFVVPPPPPGGHTLFGFDEYNNFNQIKQSTAGFVNLGYAVTPTVNLHAGARYTHDDITVKNFYALEGGLYDVSQGYAPDGGTTYWTQTIPYSVPVYGVQYSTSLQPGAAGLYPHLHQNNNNTSVRVGPDWKPTENLLLYLTFSQGYRGAAFNGQAFNAPAELNFAQPEKLNSYELGLKDQFWNQRGIFNAAAFYYDYKNQQFLDSFPLPPPGGTGFHTVNAPKSKVYGGEFELTLLATDDLKVRAALGLMHSEYVELTLHGVNLSGNQLIQAPDYNGSIGVDWRFLRLDAGELHAMADSNWYGKQYFDAPNTERIAQGSYNLTNGRIYFDSTTKRGFGAGIWIKNAFNTQYLSYGLAQRDPAQGGLGFDYSLVGEPRTYGADITYRF